VHVVIAKIAQSAAVGAVAASVSLIVLMGLWHISPVVVRKAPHKIQAPI
jgi:hypothetical protein